MYPILFRLGPIIISSYAVCIFLGVLTAAYLAGLEAWRLGLPVARFYNMIFFMCLAALAGSYLLFVAFHYQVYLANPWRFFNVLRGGLVFYGGLLGGLAVAFIYPRHHGFSWRVGMDALAVGLPVSLGIGRVGCFLAGCCFGRPTDLPWGVTYPAYRDGVIIPLHPAPLYESLLSMLVFGVVYALRHRKRFDGQIFLLYLFLASWVRFGVEFFRSPADYRGPIFWGMPLTQIFALFLALTSAILWCWGWRHGTRTTAAKLTAGT